MHAVHTSCLRWLFLVLILCGIMPPPGETAAPPSQPRLRMQGDMHTATIRRIAVDEANRLLATSSEDKTVRLWEAASGRWLKTLRPPLNAHNDGKLFAVALSPDGTLAVTGGWTGYDWDRSASLYLFHTTTGQMIRRFTGLENVVHHLAFSPDGRHVAAVLGRGEGLRVFRVEDGLLVAADRAYGGRSSSVDFAPDGRLATTDLAGLVRLYDARFQKMRQVSPPGGEQPHTVAFSPDGKELAVGFLDAPQVTILSGEDLSLFHTPDTLGVDNGNLATVAWSFDGQELYAGGTWQDGRHHLIRHWSQRGRGIFRDVPVSSDPLTDIQPRRAGGIFFGSADPSWGVINDRDRVAFSRPSVSADFRHGQAQLRLSHRGDRVRFGLSWGGKDPVTFSLPHKRLTVGGASDGLGGVPHKR